MDWWRGCECRVMEDENQELKGELARLLKLVESQAKELVSAWESCRSWRSKAKAAEPVLRAAKIAIVGPSFRRSDYQSLVEHLGGRFYFAPSNEKLSQIDRVVQRAELVVFMTGYAGHDASNIAKAAAARNGVEFAYLSSTSVSRLESYLRDVFAINAR